MTTDFTVTAGKAADGWWEPYELRIVVPLRGEDYPVLAELWEGDDAPGDEPLRGDA